MGEIEVTQADRNAAVRLLEAGGQDWQAKEIRIGDGDHFPIVQAFACHRSESCATESGVCPEITQADIDAGAAADDGAISVARSLADRESGALQSEMRAARKAYLAEVFARHREAAQREALETAHFIAEQLGETSTAKCLRLMIDERASA